MRSAAAISSYRSTAVETADTGHLLLMVYEQAIGAIQTAVAATNANDFETKGKELARAQDLITELMAGVNDDAGDIAANLKRLYAYCIRRLLVAGIQKDTEAMSEVARILGELLSAWRVAVEGPKLELATPREGGLRVSL